MELSLERKPITVNETILDINTEQAVESDMLLADYYPRISRILRCCVETSVDQAVVSGERLIVDGVALCRVFYKSEEGRPASVTVKLPYTKAVELRRAPQKPQIAVQSYPGYFSCRAVNSGRLEIRGAVVLHCRVTAPSETQALHWAEGSGMQCRCRPLCCGQLLRCSTRSLTARGEERLSDGIPSDAALLRASSRVGDTTFKAVGGKLVAKADAVTELVLIGPDGTLYREEMEIPVSEILDAEGADENAICSVSFTVDWTDAKLSSVAADEQPMVSVELSLTAWIWAMANETDSFMTDCFSTCYETTQETRPFQLLRGVEPVHRNIPIESEIPLPEGSGEVMDLWAELAEQSAAGGEGSLRLTGRVRFAGLVQTGGEPEYFEHLADFSEEIPVDGTVGEQLADFRVELQDSSRTAGGLNVRAQVKADAAMALQETARLITEAAVQEQKPVKQRGAGCLTLYFPEPGEQVWEIAKRYSTAPAAILEENGLTDDGAAGEGMLLIPAVR